MKKYLRVIPPVAAVMMLYSLVSAAEEPLLPGVKRVALGQAVSTKDPSKGDVCTIPDPLPSPVEFKAGVTEIAFIIEVDPKTAREVDASILGDLGSEETRGVNCNAYSICGGSVCQTQFGRSLSRQDGKPLKAGSYSLSIEVGGKSMSVPFTIK